MNARTFAVTIPLLLLVIAAVLFLSNSPQTNSVLPSPLSPSPSPAVCGTEEGIRSFVAAFLYEYNAGRPGLADRYFASEAQFKWYAERPSRQGEPAYRRSTLEAYLMQRHADGDHLSLVSVRLSVTQDGIGNFGFVVARDGIELQSKAAIDCASRKLIVWSLGPDPGPTP